MSTIKEPTTESVEEIKAEMENPALGWEVVPVSQADPIQMILYCPACSHQHVDAPDPENGWMNPPHKSHLCHNCGTIWRPADVETVGVLAIQTRGSADTWINNPTEEEIAQVRYSGDED